ncbi:MAG: type II secretion system protein [Acidobacteria bacterium]|nr:type II secretion system protein [Acidobacteriota bacterium]
MKQSVRVRGFTLIELLVVVAIIGLITAIAVVNFLNAIQRAKQRRTMADIRTVASALESYQMDYNSYPPASASFTLPPNLTLPSTTLGVTQAYLAPTYLRWLPLVDGWNSWLTYGTSTGFADYAVRSCGRGGEPEGSPGYGLTTDFNNDIIFVNGAFVQYPDGAQKN